MQGDPNFKAAAATLYDVVRYPSQVHSQTHPDRLSTIGTLMGMTPAAPTRCRVLEIGCGDGGNLVPMAWALPESEFTGVDLAAEPLDWGRELGRHLNLKNLSLKYANLLTIDRSWGQYDYIIVHGVYAWVPPEVKDHVLAICRECLAPQGIAFVSYNAFPGSHLSVMLREMMLFHSSGITDPAEQARQALALINLVHKTQSAGTRLTNDWLQSELWRILANPAAQLLHDELAPAYAPAWFGKFMAHAQRHGLQYVGEADFHEMSDQAFPSEVREALGRLAGDRLRLEQYRDLFKCRRFRQTLLTHATTRVAEQPMAECISGLLVRLRSELTASNMDPSPGVTTIFTTEPSGRVETDFALGKAALFTLRKCFPQGIAVTDLVRESVAALAGCGGLPNADPPAAEQVNRFLLQLYERDLLELHTWLPAIPRDPGEWPEASPLARWQIEHDGVVTSLRHQTIQVQDLVGRSLIRLLDGTRNRDQLRDEIVAVINQNRPEGSPLPAAETLWKEVEAQMESNLRQLTNLALLIR